MKRVLPLIVLIPGLAAGLNAAEPKSRASILKTWFQHLKEGLAESSVSGRYQKARVTAVAAVRGARQGAVEPDKPYWKGASKSKKAEQLKKERAELSSAVELILDGKLQEATAGLDAFEKAHPKSSLLSEVKEARDKAKELEAASAAEPPAQSQ